MATITEDYVSFETAKLLKKKGFDEVCYRIYDTKEKELFGTDGIEFQNHEIDEETITAPTLQMACKWLRVEHNILLFLLPAQENGKLVYLVEVWNWNEEEGIYESTYAPMPRKEPEKACEAAIKYCLENLI